MRTPEEIAEKFNELNIHDDTLMDIRVLPPRNRGRGSESMVEIRLSRTSGNYSKTIQFSGCANLRVAMDFDVLAHNLDPNTSGSDAHTDLQRIRDLMRAQKADWDVDYGGSHSPLWEKIEAANEFVFFRVQFFGGAVEVIARDYRVAG